jgi:nitroimidazol reductase NimA-like FMN-containing flavoprotein (pyridoxamine 5'-phosphate oxidase superfamily)
LIARSDDQHLATLARNIIDANQYLTLATADDAGRPWASPVWFAHENYTKFYWVSRPTARHSMNITRRATVSAVIFDSTVPAGQGQAVYLEAMAEELTGPDRGLAIAIFSRRSRAVGLADWHQADISAPAPHRIYRATASASYVLDAFDQRILVAPSQSDR